MSIILKNLSKSFGKKIALSNINVEFSKNKIYAIVGENGAGKSTLIKIIAKRIFADKNEFSKISFTQNEKVKIVEQIPLVALSLSVKQNAFLGIKENNVTKNCFNELIKNWCLQINADAICKDACASSKFYASLFNCLLQDFDVLILDEPTTFLSSQEKDLLFINLQKLKDAGKCIIVVTHSKKEIEKYADQIILLQKGLLKEQFFEVQSKTQDQKQKIINQIETSIEQTSMQATNNETFVQEKKCQNQNNLLFKIQYKNLTCMSQDKPPIRDISFEICSSQIIMINGLAESGLFTLEDVITGMKESKFFSKEDSGEVLFFKNDNFVATKILTARYLRKTLFNEIGLKVSIVASDKKNRAACLDLSVLEVLYSSSIEFSKKKFYKNYLDYATKVVNNTGLTINLEDKVKSLSGGMLQRLILERELIYNPDFLILCEPFAGLDIEKRKIITEKIVELKNRGKAILILSTEKRSENICDKIYKLEGGKIYD